MVLKEGEGLLQLFQHAHRRAEGHLLDFCEDLEQGREGGESLARAITDLRQHMFVEEKFLFPLARESLAAIVESLEAEHGRVLDLAEKLQDLLRRDAERKSVEASTARLMGALAAHNAAEDLGIYPDLLRLLGPLRAQALLSEVERVEPPPGWTPAARLRTPRSRPVAD